jgi:hypothetical protein
LPEGQGSAVEGALQKRSNRRKCTLDRCHRKHEQLEDPLDVTLFLWAASTARCMHANVRFVDCPPNLFRIVGLQQLYKLHNCLIQLLNPHPIG